MQRLIPIPEDVRNAKGIKIIEDTPYRVIFFIDGFTPTLRLPIFMLYLSSLGFLFFFTPNTSLNSKITIVVFIWGALWSFFVFLYYIAPKNRTLLEINLRKRRLHVKHQKSKEFTKGFPRPDLHVNFEVVSCVIPHVMKFGWKIWRKPHIYFRDGRVFFLFAVGLNSRRFPPGIIKQFATYLNEILVIPWITVENIALEDENSPIKVLKQNFLEKKINKEKFYKLAYAIDDREYYTTFMKKYFRITRRGTIYANYQNSV
ncbi:MAG: hypothetical protein ACFFCS_23795 [Candidatus Hodarchaeota archaeon]